MRDTTPETSNAPAHAAAPNGMRGTAGLIDAASVCKTAMHRHRIAAALLCAGLSLAACAADEPDCGTEATSGARADRTLRRFDAADQDACADSWQPRLPARSARWQLGDATHLHAAFGRTWTGRTALSRMEAALTTWSLAIEHRGPRRVSLVAELFGDRRAGGVWMQAGMHWAVVPSRVFMDLRWNLQPLPSQPRALTLGASVAF